MPVDLTRDAMPSEGTHLFKITSAQEKVSQNGVPQWIIEFTCQDAGPDQGTKFTEFFALEGKARFRLDMFLDGLEAPKKGTWEVGRVMNALIRVTIKHDTWEGVTRAKGQAFHPKNSTNNPAVQHSGSEGSSTLPDESKKAPF